MDKYNVQWHDGTTRVVSADVVCGALDESTGVEELWEPGEAFRFGVEVVAIYQVLSEPEEAPDLSREGLLNRLEKVARDFHRADENGLHPSPERVAYTIDKIVAEYRAGDEQ